MRETSTTPSAAPGPRSRPSTTASGGDRRPGRSGRRPRAEAHRHRRWRRAHPRLRVPPTSTTATSTARSRSRSPPLLSRSGCSRTRRAAVRGRVPAGDRHGARGLDPERQVARGGGGRQRRDVLARRRPRARRVRARARAGHDEQPDARQRPLHLLRDARRRAGRLRGRRRPERRARRDEQHAEHARRGARARVPAARRRVRGAARRGRLPAGTTAATGVVREIEALEETTPLADHRAPPAPAEGRRRRRAGRRGPQPRGTARSCRPRPRARSSRATGCESRLREVADMASPSVWPSSASGSWARRWRPTWPGRASS